MTSNESRWPSIIAAGVGTLREGRTAAAALCAAAALVLVAGTGPAFGQTSDVCGTTSWDLTAGQTNDVGTLTVENDATNIYVTYALDDADFPDAVFGTLHLWIGNDLENVPSNPQGTPVPGQFPYSADASGQTEYTFVIPFEDLSITDVPDACPLTLYVVAHAEVDTNGPDEEGGSETAFGGDQDGEGPRWWFYAEYNVCCDEEPPILTCETAFAKGGYVFTTQARSNPEGLPSLRLTRNRWGWAINLADPEDLGTTTYDIWAGAGLNNTSNGTLVGALTIDWDGLNLTVSYDLDDSYVLKEVHIYVGQDEPTTVAPGQYGYTRYFDPPVSSHNAEFDLADDGDGVWVIAHAVVCSD